MTESSLDLDAYRRRIGFDGPLAPNRATLDALIARHAATLAFENIEVLAGRVPRLDLAALVDKMVRQRRGGYCFEQNGLFFAVLQQAGFAVRTLEARVRAGVPAEVVTGRTHMALAVTLEGEELLVDVGFGGFAPGAPLALASRVPQGDGASTYRFADTEDDLMLQCRTSEGWTDCYRLLPSRPEPVDREMGNWFVATYPQAFLRHNLLVSRSTPRGRLTLHNDLLSLRPPGAAPLEERSVDTGAELADVLAEGFGLEIEAADLEAVRRVLEHRPAGT
jgi:N-hydroxyarylamine O-acetyltransferase